MTVPLTCGLLDETEAEITSDYDATSLLQELKTGTWSVEKVTTAFCKRAAIAHQLVSTWWDNKRIYANMNPSTDKLPYGDLLR